MARQMERKLGGEKSKWRHVVEETNRRRPEETEMKVHVERYYLMEVQVWREIDREI